MANLSELLDLEDILNKVEEILSDKNYVVILISLLFRTRFYHLRKLLMTRKKYYVAIAVIVALNERMKNEEESVDTGGHSE